MPSLSQKWHGVPLYGWFGGAGVLAGVGFYFWRKRGKAGLADAAVSAMPASSDSGSQPVYSGGSNGGGSNGSGSPFPPWFGDLFNPPQPAATDSTVPTVPTPVLPPAVTEHSNETPAVTPAPVVSNTNGPTATPQPAPPQPIAAAVQQALGLSPAPVGYTAFPLDLQGKTIGETLVGPNEPTVTSDWQSSRGFAPSTVAENAQPIITQGQVVGESFTPNTAPPPPALIPLAGQDQATPYGETIFGPVTRQQWEITPAANRVRVY